GGEASTCAPQARVSYRFTSFLLPPPAVLPLCARIASTLSGRRGPPARGLPATLFLPGFAAPKDPESAAGSSAAGAAHRTRGRSPRAAALPSPPVSAPA